MLARWTLRSRAKPLAQTFELLRLVEVEKLIRLYGHPCELLDLRNALEQLFPSQPRLASRRVAQKFETILGIARQL